jgi:ferredoxin-NADP reductase
MRQVVVRDTRMLSPTVRGLTLACVDGAPFSYVAGQWVNLELDVGGALDRRAYSIASAPNAARPDQFEIAVTRVEEGPVSRALHEVPEGARLAMDGPHGFFTREGLEATPALFVGTGTGVCPLRAMLQLELSSNLSGGSLARADEGRPPLALLFGVRSESEILYRAEFEALAAAHPRFRFHVTLSRPNASWSGLRGYVQSQLAGLIDTQSRPHVFVCGLSDMVNDVRRVLKEELGYDRKHIHSERYD